MLQEASAQRQSGTAVAGLVRMAMEEIGVAHSDAGWRAMQRVVGGILPKWKGEVTPTADKHMTASVYMLQELFHTRLLEWTRYAAVTGVKRQTRWNHRENMSLVFHAMRAFKHED